MSRAMLKRAWVLVLALGATGWMLACGGDDEPSGPGDDGDDTVSSISIDPDGALLTEVGQTVQFTARAFNVQNEILGGVAFTWRSSNQAAVTVSSTGLATAVAEGSAQVTAEAGAVAASVDVTVDLTETAPPASVAVVSGDGQNGKTRLAFDAPLVVRVEDADGNPTPGVTVTWSVTSGDAGLSATSTTTNSQGRAQVTVTSGTDLTDHTVRASVSGVATPAEFTVSTTVLQVFVRDNEFVDLQGRTNQDFQVTVAVGDTIEWIYDQGSVGHTITSSSEPEGGAGFDSGNLAPNQTFRFVPQVTGTWEFFCQVHPTIMLGSEIVVN